MNNAIDLVKEKGLSEAANVLEKVMLKEDQAYCPVIHSFGPGLYVREVKIPKGAFAIGHSQKHEHMNVFLKGEVTILKDDGTVETLKAPMMFVGSPGRKIGYVHEDVIWLNIYATDLKNVEELEDYYLEKSEVFGDNEDMNFNMQKVKREVDRRDYKALLDELSITEEMVQKDVQNKDDLIDLPHGSYKCKLGASPIHGKGLFATKTIMAGEIICPARLMDKRTMAGRYTNHAKEPNAIMKDNNGDINLVCLKEIKGQHAGRDGEEIVINYRDSINLLKEQNRGKSCQE